MKKSLYLFCTAAIGLTLASFIFTRSGGSGQNAAPKLKGVVIAEGLVAPVVAVYPEDGTNRLFVAEQRGLIYQVINGKPAPTPFLDIKGKVLKLNTNYDERGFLGLAFHPKFKSNRRFFVYYSAPGNEGYNHKSVIAEYQADPKDPSKALTAEKVILEINEPEWNHNGGQLLFGPDGYLYIGVGDGGGHDDQHGDPGNGQNKNTLLGKILRIDVDGKVPYGIPSDNPFVKGGGSPEIYAYGLRNPWHFSFDKVTKRLFCGDVGQDHWEEIDIIEKGKNYGWRIKEGTHCCHPEKDCPTANLVEPIYDYPHPFGISVNGGYIYRGSKYPKVAGKYVFADHVNKFMTLTEKGKKWE